MVHKGRLAIYSTFRYVAQASPRYRCTVDDIGSSGNDYIGLALYSLQFSSQYRNSWQNRLKTLFRRHIIWLHVEVDLKCNFDRTSDKFENAWKHVNVVFESHQEGMQLHAG